MPCSVQNCANVHYGLGYCAKHYARMRRNGTLTIKKAANGSKLQWVLNTALASETDECVPVPFAPGSHGYCALTTSSGRTLVHRYICEVTHGAPPTAAHEAAHSCGRRLCVNKRHLRWATPKENQADKLLHGTSLRGERHNGAKLTQEEVMAIRNSSDSQNSMAARFGVCQQTISDIKRGRRWAWL